MTYKCPECGGGTVSTKLLKNYATKISGVPFTVSEALIEVCDKCDAKFYLPEETKRWRKIAALNVTDTV